MIVEYIDANKTLGVESICDVLTEHGIAISPSTYHAHKACPASTSDLEDAYAANVLLDLWRANWGVYGVDKLTPAAACVSAGTTSAA